MVAIASAISMAMFGTYAFAGEPPPDPKKLHYELVMSEDDALCQPLTRIYSKMFGDLVHHRLDGLSNFEYTHPSELKKIGLTEVREITDQLDVSLVNIHIYSIDLFNEGAPRIVVIWDGNLGTVEYSDVYILKAGETFRLVNLKSKTTGVSIVEIDPATIDHSAGSLPDYKKLYPLHQSRAKPLTKWPGFEQIYQRLGEQKRGVFLPALEGGFVPTVRPFLFKGRPIFIEDMYTIPSPGPGDTSIVIPYKILSAGRDDLCYLALAPTFITELTKGYANGHQ
jgi:hypothetical protein